MRLSVQVWMESGGRNRPFLEHHPLDSLKENFKVGDSVSLNMRRLEGHIKYKFQVYFSDAESVRTGFLLCKYFKLIYLVPRKLFKP